MSIRQALRRQSILTSQSRGKETPQWWCGSNAILVMMAGILAIVFAAKILLG